MAWLIDNLATILISLLIAGIVTLIIVHAVRRRKAGKGSCGCNCASCAYGGSCCHCEAAQTKTPEK